MSDVDLQRWLPIAKALDPSEIRALQVPKSVFLGEAADLAQETKARWEPKDGTPSLAKNGERFTFEIIEELFSLRRAALEAEARWILLIDPKTPGGLTERAREVLRELIVSIGYLLDDDIEEPADAQFAKMKAEHPNAANASVDALSGALYGFAALAETLLTRLEALEDEHFQPAALIKEAKELSQKLAELPSGPQPPSSESRAALNLRDRLHTLIEKRCALIRNAADFKFGLKFPEIAKKFLSAYQRRRRTALARKKKQEGTLD